MRCPSCNEETFEEELIAGKCPLCGSKIMDSKGACLIDILRAVHPLHYGL